MQRNQFLKTLAASLVVFTPLAAVAQAKKELKALLLTGGGYHDYDSQKTILTEGLSKRLNIKWTIIHKDANGAKEVLSEKGWADSFDVVVYNICYADETDGDYVEKLTDSHAGKVPAVIVHCALHSYHWKTKNDAWTKFIGVTSMRHGKQAPIDVKTVANDHPIMKRLPKEWKTPNGELYHIDKVEKTATVLAEGSIDEWDSKHAVVWVNDFKNTRIFGTSIGHHNETMESKEFLDLVAFGTLWATNHLSTDGRPDPAYLAPK